MSATPNNVTQETLAGLPPATAIRAEEASEAGPDTPPRTELEFGKRPYPLADLEAANLKPPAELVENVIYEGEKVALVGRPKTGKTRLAQQLAVAVASGGEFLGQKVLKPMPVLYLYLEGDPEQALSRFKSIAGDNWASVRHDIHAYVVPSLAESIVSLSDEGLAHIQGFLETTKAGFLIIDTWRLAFKGKENDAQSVVKNLNAVSRLRAVDDKLTTLWIHHPRKMGGDNTPTCALREDPQLWLENTSGSLAFIAHIDSAYGLEEDSSGGDEAYVLTGIRRNAAAPLFVLRSDEETLRFEPLEDVELQARWTFTPKQFELWRKLPQCFDWAAAEKVAGGPSAKSGLKRTLDRATVNGLIKRGEAGRYEKIT